MSITPNASSSEFESDSTMDSHAMSTGYHSDESDSDFEDADSLFRMIAYGVDERQPGNPQLDRLRAYYREHESSIPIDLLSNQQFIRTFRMTAAHFETLLKIVAPALKARLPAKAIQSRLKTKYAVLSPVMKLQISLRLLAGGSYLDLICIHKVSHQTLYNSFQQFYCFVASGKAPELRIKFPTQRLDLEEKARRFQLARGNTKELYGCVGALDGLQVRIKKPSRTTVPNVLSYCGRNKYFSVNVQAICDADLQFTFVSVETPGATHDNTAFTGTEFSDNWNSASTSDPFWLAGDEAYSSMHNLVTPWPGRLLNGDDRLWRDSFNYYFSAGSRNTIERSFGVLVTKWGIFWRPLEYHLEDVPRIILTAFVMHNFCLTDSGAIEYAHIGTGPGAARGNESDGELSFDIVTTSDYLGRDETQTRRTREKCAKRDAMTLALKRNGILRPHYMNE